MENSKSWYLSKGVIGAVIVVAVTILNLVGQGKIGEALQGETDAVVELIATGVILASGVVALWGRLFAKEEIK